MKNEINILIVDDEVVKNRFTSRAQEYFDIQLWQAKYPFKINVLDEKIINQERLWSYLNDNSKTKPDFILLDWLFENEEDVSNNFYTGKVILSKLMQKKAQAFNNELEEAQNTLYKNLEVIAFSSYIKVPPSSNLEDMLLGGCIAAVAKDAFNISGEEEKSFLLECIKKWLMLRDFGETPDPSYDGNRFGELDPNLKLQWRSNRQALEGERAEKLKIEEKKDITKLEESNYFVLFQKIVLGESFDSIEGTGIYLNQSKKHINDKFLNQIAKGDKIRTGEVHRWFHIAVEQQYPFIVEYLAKKGFHKRKIE